MQTLCLYFLAVVSVCAALDNGLGRKPAMGFNTWNKFHCAINEQLVRDTADALVSTGLNKYYTYLNIDDCWASSRDANGTIVADATAFPSGIPALVDYVHSKGLKFGIYSDAGSHTCAGRPGSLGYEKNDANTYAQWKVDYLKYDNCNSGPTEPQVRYSAMRDALNATGRPILFSMCDWGTRSPWRWAQSVGNSWRTTDDVQPDWNSLLRCLDNNIGLSAFAGPGGFNDFDMLEVGNEGISDDEGRAHFALWALGKSPLLIGCDVTQMSDTTKATLLADEIIAINQDPLGVPGDLVRAEGPEQIWAGPLSDGSRAVVMFNRHTQGSPYKHAPMTLDFTDLGLSPMSGAHIRDLYAKTDLGVFYGEYSAQVPLHGVVVVKVTPTDDAQRTPLWRPSLSSRR